MIVYICSHLWQTCFLLSGLCFASVIVSRIRAARAAAAMIAAQEEESRMRAAARTEAARIAAEKKAAATAAAEAKKAEQARKQEERKAAREAARLEKLEVARMLAEYNERALQAAKDLQALETARRAPEAPAVHAEPEAPAKRPETILKDAPRPFAGQVVSFTGRLQSMKRADAIAAVKAAGGRAYADFPAGTTLLVVGINPGQKKQDKFDRWIGQVKKITEAQFLDMLKGA